MKLPVEMTLEGAAEAAANEMDGLLGQRYTVPISVSVNDPSEKDTAYWLQQVSSMIAAGRIMLSLGAPGSNDTANNYGKYLIKNAMDMIALITDGKRSLAGAVENEDGTAGSKGPIILQGDRYSQVDMYYENMMPDGLFPGALPPQGGAAWPR